MANLHDLPQIASPAGVRAGFERASPVFPVLAQSGQRDPCAYGNDPCAYGNEPCAYGNEPCAHGD